MAPCEECFRFILLCWNSCTLFIFIPCENDCTDNYSAFSGVLSSVHRIWTGDFNVLSDVPAGYLLCLILEQGLFLPPVIPVYQTETAFSAVVRSWFTMCPDWSAYPGMNPFQASELSVFRSRGQKIGRREQAKKVPESFSSSAPGAGIPVPAKQPASIRNPDGEAEGQGC